MKFMDKVLGSIGLFEPVEDDKIIEEPESKPKKTSGSSGGTVVSLPTVQKQMQVMVVEPFSFDDAQHIADHLKSRRPVVINLESADTEVAKRLIDFISGTAYALGGSMQKIGTQIFLCAPHNVEIDLSSRGESSVDGSSPWNR